MFSLKRIHFFGEKTMASAEEIANITSENGRHKTECNENDYDARFDFLWKRRSIEKLEGNLNS